MARRLPAREDLRVTMARNNAKLNALIKLHKSDAPTVEIPASVQMKAKRTNKPRDPDAEYESDIQEDIIAMLRVHPKVRIVERHNSGKAMEIGADGKKRFIGYNKVFKIGKVRMRKADIDCTLTNGKRFVVEVKRPPWSRPSDQREYEQENYINHVRAATGYGLFATSVLEVDAALAAIQI